MNYCVSQYLIRDDFAHFGATLGKDNFIEE